MRLPFRNATVIAIAGHGYSDDWDDSATAGATTWTGTADAFLSDDRQNEYTDGRATTIVTRSIVVPKDLPVTVGDTLTVRWRDSTVTATVRAVLRSEPPKGVGLSATTRLEIELG